MSEASPGTFVWYATGGRSVCHGRRSPRRFGRAALAGLFVGCQHEVPPPVVVAIPPAPATASTKPPPPTPASRSREASLTWAFSPTLRESEAGPLREIVILFAVGAEEHRFVLGRRYGTLVQSEQSVCEPAAKKGDVVSFVTLNTMGVTHLVARRIAPDAIEVSFTVEADDEPAKTHGILARIPVPPGLDVVDHVRVVRADGSQGPLDCASASEE